MKRIRIGYIFLILLAIFLVGRAFLDSLFVKNPDRIQIVVYGKNTRYYSLGIRDDLHYYLYFAPDVKILIPHGYGYYRIGALRKLVQYDNRPEVFKEGFSTATSTLVNYYFYPEKSDIYFGKDVEEGIQLPSLSDIFIMKSNASFLDRIYFFLRFVQIRKTDFTVLPTDGVIRHDQDDLIFSEKNFAEKYIGYFYQKTYRSERKTVQIIYSNKYATADTIGNILENSGIRTIDISKKNENNNNCRVIEQGSSLSHTAKDLARFFGCSLENGKTQMSDIILILGSQEKEWEI